MSTEWRQFGVARVVALLRLDAGRIERQQLGHLVAGAAVAADGALDQDLVEAGATIKLAGQLDVMVADEHGHPFARRGMAGQPGQHGLIVQGETAGRIGGKARSRGERRIGGSQ